MTLTGQRPAPTPSTAPMQLAQRQGQNPHTRRKPSAGGRALSSRALPLHTPRSEHQPVTCLPSSPQPGTESAVPRTLSPPLLCQDLANSLLPAESSPRCHPLHCPTASCSLVRPAPAQILLPCSAASFPPLQH